MSADFLTAQDEMFAILKTGAEAAGYPVAWPGVQDEPPTTEVVWLRPTLRHGNGGQSTLGSEPLYEMEGFLIIDVFSPEGLGRTELYNASKTIYDLYRGVSTNSGVWFKNHTIQEQPTDGRFARLTIYIEFQYCLT